MIVADPHMPTGERTKLLDFGIAKFTAEKDQGSLQTQVSVLLGSPSYMSPEQCRGAGHVDDRTDVYALGCMLYEMLSGRPPFSGNSMPEVMAKHQFEPHVPLGKVTAGVPSALLALVDRLLVKDKAQRPPMSQLLEGLETVREQLPRVMQRRSARLPMLRSPGPAVAVRFASTLSHSVGQGLNRLRSTTTPSILIGASVGILILGGLFTYDRLASRRPPHSAPLAVPPPPPSVAPPTAPVAETPPPPAASTDPVAATPADGKEPETPAKPGHHHHKAEPTAKPKKHHRHSADSE